ncbi:hypothetical protein [Microvirga zambiensis]|uniref:hypothetical protein n=1 Tax=Microvirga zambiensis TaxID=1402137 RepID=UPI00191EF1BC|nr:hypothetical protein [Microvirga zambiensis]
MKTLNFNTKAVWSAPVRVADADGTTYGVPVILTGSRLKLSCMDAAGALVGEATTDDGSIVIVDPAPTASNQPEPNLEITLAVDDRPGFVRSPSQPISVMADLYRSTDGSEPSEWVCRIPITLYPGA